jgi:hypothetical protein
LIPDFHRTSLTAWRSPDLDSQGSYAEARTRITQRARAVDDVTG